MTKLEITTSHITPVHWGELGLSQFYPISVSQFTPTDAASPYRNTAPLSTKWGYQSNTIS